MVQLCQLGVQLCQLGVQLCQLGVQFCQLGVQLCQLGVQPFHVVAAPDPPPLGLCSTTPRMSRRSTFTAWDVRRVRAARGAHCSSCSQRCSSQAKRFRGRCPSSALAPSQGLPRLAALGGSGRLWAAVWLGTPRRRGRATVRPATISVARACRIQSRRAPPLFDPPGADVPQVPQASQGAAL